MCSRRCARQDDNCEWELLDGWFIPHHRTGAASERKWTRRKNPRYAAYSPIPLLASFVYGLIDTQRQSHIPASRLSPADSKLRVDIIVMLESGEFMQNIASTWSIHSKPLRSLFSFSVTDWTMKWLQPCSWAARTICFPPMRFVIFFDSTMLRSNCGLKLSSRCILKVYPKQSQLRVPCTLFYGNLLGNFL